MIWTPKKYPPTSFQPLIFKHFQSFSGLPHSCKVSPSLLLSSSFPPSLVGDAQDWVYHLGRNWRGGAIQLEGRCWVGVRGAQYQRTLLNIKVSTKAWNREEGIVSVVHQKGRYSVKYILPVYHGGRARGQRCRKDSREAAGSDKAGWINILNIHVVGQWGLPSSNNW